MAILHRALFTWFIFLVFLILLCLRLESRTHWNWFIVFIPMWVYDSILLIYVLFHMISHCKNGIDRFRSTINKNVWYIAAIGLKMASQIIICIKLEYAKLNLPIYVVMTPIWMLLPVISVDVFFHLIKHSSGSSSVTAMFVHDSDIVKYLVITTPLEGNIFFMMPSVAQDFTDIKYSSVKEVAAGSDAELKCNSNDQNNNFMFWLFDNDKAIGPLNEKYDHKKYKYEVLSGTLHIKNVSPEEAGYYKCVSKKVDGSGLNISGVQMIVKDTFSSGDAIKLVAVIASIIVIITCAIIYYKLRKDWRKYEGRKIIPVDEVYDDDDGDEVYNRTTTVIDETVPGTSKTTSDILLYGIDNQGLDTDFNSVFENIQIKRIH